MWNGTYRNYEYWVTPVKDDYFLLEVHHTHGHNSLVSSEEAQAEELFQRVPSFLWVSLATFLTEGEEEW